MSFSSFILSEKDLTLRTSFDLSGVGIFDLSGSTIFVSPTDAGGSGIFNSVAGGVFLGAAAAFFAAVAAPFAGAFAGVAAFVAGRAANAKNAAKIAAYAHLRKNKIFQDKACI